MLANYLALESHLMTPQTVERSDKVVERQVSSLESLAETPSDLFYEVLMKLIPFLLERRDASDGWDPSLPADESTAVSAILDLGRLLGIPLEATDLDFDQPEADLADIDAIVSKSLAIGSVS